MQARYALISSSPQTYCLYFPASVLQFFSACARLLLIPSLRCAKLGVASADAASVTASAVISVLILIMVGLLLSFCFIFLARITSAGSRETRSRDSIAEIRRPLHRADGTAPNHNENA